MRTTNPVLKEGVFQQERTDAASGTMTMQGVVNKTLMLLFLLMMSAYWTWGKVMQALAQAEGGAAGSHTLEKVGPILVAAFVGALVTGIMTPFVKKWSPVTAPVYAVCEGLLLGGLSAVFELQYQGIVFQAAALTVFTLLSLLIAYKSGLIRATENFKMGIVAATGAIFLIYVVNLIMGFFGGQITMINSHGPFGIIFSLIVVTVAALNLVLDFDFIEHGTSSGAPKYMEWYAGFGLMVTLVWLYIELLRLLAKMRRR